MVEWEEYGLWSQRNLGSKPVPTSYRLFGQFSYLWNKNTILPGKIVVKIRNYVYKVTIME